jgi:hypothetical protein
VLVATARWARELAGTPQKALDQAQAQANKKKMLISPGAANQSQNLGGSKTAEKQCGSADTRVYYGVVLTRGVVGVIVFLPRANFPGECPEGARMLVARLPALLNKMLGKDTPKPRTLLTDRGPGFYHRRWGTITGDYESACRAHSFRQWAGTNAKQGAHAQPPDLADMLLHETAVPWIVKYLDKTTPRSPWDETCESLAARIRAAAAHANANYQVKKLCLEFPQRLHDLVHKHHGDRLPK